MTASTQNSHNSFQSTEFATTTQSSNASSTHVATPMAMSSSLSESDYLLACKASSAKILSNILSSIYFGKRDQWATFVLDRTAMKIVVEEDKVLQASATLNQNMFQEYSFKSDTPTQFQVNLANFIDVLNLYGAASEGTAAHICYPGIDGTLVLLLTEGEIVTDCSMRTRDAEDPMEFRFREFFSNDNKLIVRSELLKEAFNEVEWMGNSVWLTVSPETLYIQAEGTPGSLEMHLQKNTDAFFQYECTEEKQNSYPLTHLQKSIKALGLAARTCLRINDNSVLSLQHMLRTSPENYTIIEFLLCSDNIAPQYSATF
eukprot:gb/GECH01008353.1/.p1 GENE.gb/GECH01008353.1/~~gb/GECH01008353.1/.p1  ORF type:complete len:316 (+),score=78.10 gb/GECH01008353.1/:1-948(+)